MTKPTILLTGAAGRIGQAVAQELGSVARGFDLVPTPNLKDFVVGDLLDVDTVRTAVEGIETIVHLAATPDDVEDHEVVEKLFQPNIVGVYNLLEAARHANVKRLILASSGQTVWYQRDRGPYPISTDTLPTPRGWYACTKMFLEAAGRSFHEKYGMSVILVRLGWCPRDRSHVQAISEHEPSQDIYMSPRDAGRFFAAAVRAPESTQFAIVYATSKPLHSSPYDLEPTRRLIGFEPEDQWPQGIEVVTGA
ncbi:MAG: NAD-dependent epimerase/dehydratase family protein [Gemmataceae bacterium]